MTDVSVNFLTSHPPHLANLVVSLHSLRDTGWDEPIYVHAWPESIDIVKQIAADKRLGVEAIEKEPGYRKKNAQFIHKQLVMQSIPTEMGIYLDCDTMPVKPINELLDRLNHFGFIATQFNRWHSNHGVTRNRIKRLVDREGIPQDRVQDVLSREQPSLNGGVFACWRDSPVLPKWHELTGHVKDIFIADETVLHVVMSIFRFDSIPYFDVLEGGTHNCSPKYKPKDIPDEDVVIWHFHGDSNLRPDTKSQKGYNLWWPVFQECLDLNLGGICDWLDRVGNKYLTKCLKKARVRGR